jgi:hypothetical protein
MNIVQIQKDLRNVPMNSLIRYVQDGNPEVPAYLALTELKRRKSMEQEYQARAAGQPKKTVAENLVDEAKPKMDGIESLMPGQAPSEGVAGLPMREDMLAEKNFAGGGIVAFEEGGFLSKARDYLLPPSPTTMRSLQGQTRNPFMGGMAPADTDPTTLLYQLKALNEKPNKTLDDYNQINAVEQQIKSAYQDTRGGYTPPTPAAKSADQVAAENLLKDTSAKNIPAGITSALPKELTLDEAIAQQKAAYDKMGVNKDFYAEQKTKNETDRQALKEDRDQALYMAMITGGLSTAAGKSPFALQNAAEGLGKGVTQYAGDIKDINKEKNLLKAADDKLAEAQYLQSRGDADGALKAMREHEKLMVQAKQHQDTVNATLEAARISSGARSGAAQLPALYNALVKAEGNPTLQAQIQNRINQIELGTGGGSGVDLSKWGYEEVKKS